MRSNFNDRINFSQYLSREFVNEINKTISRGEQVILLHNRRGYANVQICKVCDWIFNCPDCSISLTYHKTEDTMLCHHCNYKTIMKSQCLNCDSYELEIIGSGTQKIEDEIGLMLPNSKIIRLDIDSSKRKGLHYKILNKFKKQEYNILLGTQMIAKGLDFDNVTFVGIVNADVGLFLPDFRSGEKTFQLIYQVVGRSGRHKKPGKAIIQTFNPKEMSIKTAAHQDLKQFYNASMSQRNDLFYPPFSRIARFICSGIDKIEVKKRIYSIFYLLKKIDGLKILGPSIAPLEKIRNSWRYHILIKYDIKSPHILHNNVQGQILSMLDKPVNNVKIQLDIDPISIL